MPSYGNFDDVVTQKVGKSASTCCLKEATGFPAMSGIGFPVILRLGVNIRAIHALGPHGYVPQ